MPMKTYLSAFVVAWGILSLHERAEADLVVSFAESLSIQEGQSGSLDVLISSDASPPFADRLDLYSAKFRIEAVSGGGLAFAAVQSETHLSDSSYIFFGDNLGVSGAAPSAPDTFLASDGTLSGGGVIVPDTNRLLFRLDLDASLAIAGSEFRVWMVDDAFTSFNDPAIDPIDVRPSSFSSFGTVNITAVPEPSAACVVLFGAASTLLWRSRRRGPDSPT